MRAVCRFCLVSDLRGRREILPPLQEVTLQHHAYDICTLCDLCAEALCDLGLILMILLGVSVGAVYHDALMQLLAHQLFERVLNVLLAVVGARLATTEHTMREGISL